MIADEDTPIRASRLPKLLECPASVLLDALPGSDDYSGPAAQMGSLVHEGVKAFHLNQDGLAAMEAAREKFPLGDFTAAVRHYEAYTADEENKTAQIVYLEHPITCRLPDPLGGPGIVISGTLDQVLLDRNGRHVVADVKTGSAYYGRTALRHYLAQQAAYTFGARQTFGLDVQAGKLISTDGYFRRNGKVHWMYEDEGIDLFGFASVLASVADLISNARRGRIGVNPSDANCTYCKHREPRNCLPLLRRDECQMHLSPKVLPVI